MHPEIDAFRGFSRFYTRQLGTLNEGILQTRYSLTEARILYELAAKPGTTAAELGEALRLDQGYMSRTISKLHKSRLISRKPVLTDARRTALALTKAGHAEFEILDERSNHQVRDMLRPL